MEARLRVRLPDTIPWTVDGESDSLLRLGLNPAYDVEVGTAAGAPVPVERDGAWIGVRLGEGAGEVDDTTVLRFSLEGDLGRSGDESRRLVEDSSLFLLWSDRWYPIAFDDWATVRIRVSLPTGWEIVAPGREVGGEPDRAEAAGVAPGAHDRAWHVFQTREPVVAFTVIADPRWIADDRVVDGLPMRTLLHPESVGHRERVYRTSRDVIRFYASLYGGYPFEGFTFVTVPGIYARRAFPGFVGYSPAYLDREMERTGHDAHETALLWWGYTLRGRGPGAWQWTEGFGDYAEFLYDWDRGLPLPAIFGRFRAEYLALPPEEDRTWRELGGAPQAIVHGKYPWLMDLVRQAAGPAAFARAMTLLFDRYRWRTFSMDELVATLEVGTGTDLGWWRADWLETRGVPELEWTAEIGRARAGAGQEGGVDAETRWRVRVAIRQQARARRFPLEIGIRTAAGLRVEREWVESPRQSFEIELDDEPLAVTLDPRERLLLHATRR